MNFYGFCNYEEFVLVKDDFFERVGASYLNFDSKSVAITIGKEENAKHFMHLDEALRALQEKDDHMLLEWRTPKYAQSSVVFQALLSDSLYRKNGFCSLYIAHDKNGKQLMAHSADGQCSLPIFSEKDVYMFKGFARKSLPNDAYLACVLNHPFWSDFQAGVAKASEMSNSQANKLRRKR